MVGLQAKRRRDVDQFVTDSCVKMAEAVAVSSP